MHSSFQKVLTLFIFHLFPKFNLNSVLYKNNMFRTIAHIIHDIDLKKFYNFSSGM